MPAQEAVAVALCKSLLLPLDDPLWLAREVAIRTSRAPASTAACGGMASATCAI